MYQCNQCQHCRPCLRGKLTGRRIGMRLSARGSIARPRGSVIARSEGSATRPEGYLAGIDRVKQAPFGSESVTVSLPP